MSKALRVGDYLEHNAKAIERIERYTQHLDQSEFLNSDLVQDAVIRNLEIIGEAASSILKYHGGFAARHQDIPWQVMYTMRNRLSHAYHSVDVEIVWKTVKSDLPNVRLLVNTASKNC